MPELRDRQARTGGSTTLLLLVLLGALVTMEYFNLIDLIPNFGR